MRLNRRFVLLSSGGGGSFAIPTFDGSHAIFGDEKQGYIELYSSGTLTLPKKGVVDVFMIGGGQKGGFGSGTVQPGTTNIGFPIYGGKGGDGGKVITLFGVEVEAGTHSVTIASAAGNSSFDGTNTSSGNVAAVGAAAPVMSLIVQGSEAGKKGINGNNADFAFGDSNFPRYGGSGGSGLAMRASANFAQSSGGTLGGGSGAGYRSNGATILEATAGTANTGGGGGGGGYDLNMWQSSPASGGSGIVIIRWGYDAA